MSQSIFAGMGVRGGTRGGKDQFKWEDVRGDKFKENYLGQSTKLADNWWGKGELKVGGVTVKADKNNRAQKMAEMARQNAEEIRRVKEQENQLMLEAMGLRPKTRVVSGKSLEKHEMQELIQRGNTERDDTDINKADGLGFSGSGGRLGLESMEPQKVDRLESEGGQSNAGLSEAPVKKSYGVMRPVALEEDSNFTVVSQDDKSEKKHKKEKKDKREKKEKKEKRRRERERRRDDKRRSPSPRRRSPSHSPESKRHRREDSEERSRSPVRSRHDSPSPQRSRHDSPSPEPVRRERHDSLSPERREERRRYSPERRERRRSPDRRERYHDEDRNRYREDEYSRYSKRDRSPERSYDRDRNVRHRS